MLAQRGTVADLEKLAARGFWFDLKIDGIRALATVDASADGEPTLSLTSRNGIDLAGRYPELSRALFTLNASGAPGQPPVAAAKGGLVLDGEIAVPGPDGLPSWPLTHRRTAQRGGRVAVSDQPRAVLYIFDLLRRDGVDTSPLPLRERREMLREMCAGFPAQLELTPVSDDFAKMWDFVLSHDLEGLIAKDPESRYVAGRSRDWVKVKATQSLTCLVGGVEWAPEAATEPRSLQLYLVDAAGDLTPIGKASAGVSPAIRPALLAGLRNPPLIVEVEYTQITPAGVLRNPVIRAVRTDVDVLDCSTDQLT
jgi:bifunctional non-homologous end joining protein LigD